MNTFVIGDIHGGFKGLQQVLEKSKFDKDTDTLITLGDYCDGWSETVEVIEELLTIKNLIPILGNHDWWLRNWLSEELNLNGFDFNYDEKRVWLKHGGEATVKSYEKNKELKEKHYNFLLSCKTYHLDENNNVFVHAGLNLKQPIDKQFHRYYGYDCYFWDRDMWEKAYAGRSVKNNFKNIYIGHTPTINYPNNKGTQYQPITRNNITNMDTGAAFNGMLSMLNINTHELFQSDKLMNLYPNEKGRN